MMRIPILSLLRPHQWIKNSFVLIGVIFSHRWEAPVLIQAGFVFLAFCAGASSVYIVNDIMDVESDRQHPKKCRRAIASGAVSIRLAAFVGGGLLLLGIFLAMQASLAAVAFLLAYWCLHLVYSMYFKHVPVLDVFVIATGFMLRLLAGTFGIGLATSNWLFLCGMMITLFLGFAKRRAELLMITAQTINGQGGQGGHPVQTRRVLEKYSSDLLDHCLSVCAASTIITYGLYTMSPNTIALHHTDQLIYTLPFIVYGIFRYIYLLHETGEGEDYGNDTARDLLKDRHLLVTVIAWLVSTLSILACAG